MSLPSLLLIPDRYKATKLYSQLPQSGAGDMVATRATTATRVNPAGLIEVVGIDVPRIDYTGGGCPSLLIEPSRTNTMLHGQDFTNGVWTTVGLNAVAANTTIAPDGTLTADTITANGANSSHRVFQIIDGVNGVPNNPFIWVKKGTADFVQIAISGGGFGTTNFANFDLITGVLGTSGGLQINNQIEVHPDGWYKISTQITPTSTASGQIDFVIVQVASAVRLQSWASSATVIIWQAQFTAGSGGLSEIPTGASAVTRGADILSLSGASALIGQTEGTIFVEVVYNAGNSSIVGDQPIIVVGTDANNSSAILLQGSTGANPNRVIGRTFNGGVSQALIVSPNAQVSGVIKIAYTYTANSFKLFVNGVKVGEDLSGTVPTGGNIFFGNFDASGALFTIRLNAASLEKIVISEAEAIALTTI